MVWFAATNHSMMTRPMVGEEMSRWSELKNRWQHLIEVYGPVAFGVWFAVFGVVFAGFVVAIELGFQPEGVAGQTGKWGMAYVATQLTKPLRIVVVLFLTPVVARVMGRHRVANSSTDAPTIAAGVGIDDSADAEDEDAAATD